MVRKLLFAGLLSMMFLLGLVACNPAGQAIEPIVPLNDSVTETPAPTLEPTVEPFTATLDWRILPNHFLPDTPLMVNFNRPVNPTSSPAPLLIEPAINGDFAWDETFTKLTFSPRYGFEPGAIYTITPNNALMSANGQTMAEPPTWHILVVTRPGIIERAPADIELSTNRQPTISLTFDRPMNQASVAAALHVSPVAELQLEWQENTLIIQPLTALNPGSNYNFTLGDRATDQEGVAITAYHWPYRTAKLIEQTSWPSATRPEPQITIQFNYAIEPTSANVLITPTLNGQMSWDINHTLLTYTFTSPPAGGTYYTIRLADGLRDSQGNELPAPYVGSFTTPNAITSVSPASNTTVNPYTTIQVTFNRPVNQPTLETAFSVTPELPGRIEWHDNILEFHPDAGYLSPNITYQVTIADTALSAEGQPLLSTPFTWSFSTSIYEAEVMFGDGEQSQVLDAAGPRAIQFAFPYREEPVLSHFELFPLALTDWLQGDLHGYEPMATWDEAPTPRLESEYTHVQQTFVPTDVPPGLYLLKLVTASQTQASLVLFISQHTLVVKQDAEKVFVWLSEMDGTTPAGTEIAIYDAQGNLFSVTYSDNNGFATFDLPDSEQEWKIVARPEGDLTAVVLSQGWQVGNNSNWQPGYLAHIITDRHVYHPGQLLNFRAIIRWDNDHTPVNIPAGTKVTINLYQGYDEWSRELQATQELTSNDFGTVNSHFDLPNSLPAGDYSLELVIDRQTFRQLFQVSAIGSASQLLVTTDAPRYALGQSIMVTVLALDENGQPITNQAITIRQSESVFNDCYYYYGYEQIWLEVPNSTISGRTNDSGRFTATIPVTFDCGGYENMEGEQIIRAIQATLVNNGQEIANFALVEFTRQAESISLDMGSRLQIAGHPFTIEAEVTNLSQAEVADRQLTLTLLRYEVNVSGFNQESPLSRTTLTSDSSGRISHNLTIDRPGYYQAILSGRDAFGNSYNSQQTFYVYNPSYEGVYGPPTSLSVEPDKTDYQVGDIARLIIRSDFNGPALLTFSRGLLHRQQLLNLTAPMTLLEVPVLSDDAPNLQVTIHAWQPQSESDYTWVSLPDALLKMASTVMNVTDKNNTLTISLSGLNETAPAGSPTTFTLRVTDSAGNPVSAELSLSLVNQWLFDNYQGQAQPIASSLLATRTFDLSTYHSLAPVRYMDGWGGYGCGGGWWGTQTELLGDFIDSGLWLPALYTDANGEVTVSLTLPETAGTWQLSLQAITINTQIGQTSVRIVTH